jgi:SAM-dependent methyltransferase
MALEARPAGELYDEIGRTYSGQRCTDRRIAARVWQALGDARTVPNVGAGTGSYEPPDREVIAVEPSETMRAQRAPGAAPCVVARAEALPFDDNAFDAAMAVLSDHHWEDPIAGLREMRRVAKRVVVFQWGQHSDRRVLARPRLPPGVSRDRSGPSDSGPTCCGDRRRNGTGTDPVGLSRWLFSLLLASPSGLPAADGKARNLGVGPPSARRPKIGRCERYATISSLVAGVNAIMISCRSSQPSSAQGF